MSAGRGENESSGPAPPGINIKQSSQIAHEGTGHGIPGPLSHHHHVMRKGTPTWTAAENRETGESTALRRRMGNRGTLTETMRRKRGIDKNAENASVKRELSPALLHPWRPSPSPEVSGNNYAAVEPIHQAATMGTTTKKAHMKMIAGKNASGPEREYVSPLLGYD